MKPDTPILVITLHIPVQADTSADEVLDAIGQQVSEALYAIRQQQADQEQAEEAVFEPAVNEFRSEETLEPYGENTRDDLLSALGYKYTV
jgi:hypothetical protein